MESLCMSICTLASHINKSQCSRDKRLDIPGALQAKLDNHLTIYLTKLPPWSDVNSQQTQIAPKPLLSSLSLLIDSVTQDNKWLFLEPQLFAILLKLFLKLKKQCENVADLGFYHLATALEKMEIDSENGLPVKKLRSFKKEVGESGTVLKDLFVGFLSGGSYRRGVELMEILIRGCDDNKRIMKGQCSQNFEMLGRRIMDESVDFVVKFACVKLMLEILNLNRRLPKKTAIPLLSFFTPALQHLIHPHMFFSEKLLSGFSTEKAQHKDIFRFLQSVNLSIQETYEAFQVKIHGRIVASDFVFLVVSETVTIYVIATETNYPTQIEFKTASVKQIKVYDEPCDTEGTSDGTATSVMTIHFQPDTTVKYGFGEFKAVPDVQIRCFTSKVDELADAIDKWLERIEKLGETESGLAAIPGEILNLSVRHDHQSSADSGSIRGIEVLLKVPNEVAHEAPLGYDRLESPVSDGVPLDAPHPGVPDRPVGYSSSVAPELAVVKAPAKVIAEPTRNVIKAVPDSGATQRAIVVATPLAFGARVSKAKPKSKAKSKAKRKAPVKRKEKAPAKPRTRPKRQPESTPARKTNGGTIFEDVADEIFDLSQVNSVCGKEQGNAKLGDEPFKNSVERNLEEEAAEPTLPAPTAVRDARHQHVEGTSPNHGAIIQAVASKDIFGVTAFKETIKAVSSNAEIQLAASAKVVETGNTQNKTGRTESARTEESGNIHVPEEAQVAVKTVEGGETLPRRFLDTMAKTPQPVDSQLSQTLPGLPTGSVDEFVECTQVILMQELLPSTMSKVISKELDQSEFKMKGKPVVSVPVQEKPAAITTGIHDKLGDYSSEFSDLTELADIELIWRETPEYCFRKELLGPVEESQNPQQKLSVVQVESTPPPEPLAASGNEEGRRPEDPEEPEPKQFSKMMADKEYDKSVVKVDESVECDAVALPPVITKEAVKHSKHQVVKKKLDKAQQKLCANRARINTALPALDLLFSELPDPDSLFEAPTNPAQPPLFKQQPQQPPDRKHCLRSSSPPQQFSLSAQQRSTFSFSVPHASSIHQHIPTSTAARPTVAHQHTSSVERPGITPSPLPISEQTINQTNPEHSSNYSSADTFSFLNTENTKTTKKSSPSFDNTVAEIQKDLLRSEQPVQKNDSTGDLLSSLHSENRVAILPPIEDIDPENESDLYEVPGLYPVVETSDMSEKQHKKIGKDSKTASKEGIVNQDKMNELPINQQSSPYGTTNNPTSSSQPFTRAALSRDHGLNTDEPIVYGLPSASFHHQKNPRSAVSSHQQRNSASFDHHHPDENTQYAVVMIRKRKESEENESKGDHMSRKLKILRRDYDEVRRLFRLFSDCTNKKAKATFLNILVRELEKVVGDFGIADYRDFEKKSNFVEKVVSELIGCVTHFFDYNATLEEGRLMALKPADFVKIKHKFCLAVLSSNIDIGHKLLALVNADLENRGVHTGMSYDMNFMEKKEVLSSCILAIVHCEHKSPFFQASVGNQYETNLGIPRYAMDQIIKRRSDYLQSTDETEQKELLHALITDLEDSFGSIGAYEEMEFYPMHCLANNIVDMMIESETLATASDRFSVGESDMAAHVEDFAQPGEPSQSEESTQSEELAQSEESAQSEEPAQSEAIAPTTMAAEEEKSKHAVQGSQLETVQSYPQKVPLPATSVQPTHTFSECAPNTELLDEGFFEHVDKSDSPDTVITTLQDENVHQPAVNFLQTQESSQPCIAGQPSDISSEKNALIAANPITDDSQNTNSGYEFRSTPPAVGSLFTDDEHEPTLPILPSEAASSPKALSNKSSVFTHSSSRVSLRNRSHAPSPEEALAEAAKRRKFQDENEDEVEPRIKKGNLLIIPKNGSPIPKETASYAETRNLVFSGWRYGIVPAIPGVPTWPTKQIKEAYYRRAYCELTNKKDNFGFTSQSKCGLLEVPVGSEAASNPESGSDRENVTLADSEIGFGPEEAWQKESMEEVSFSSSGPAVRIARTFYLQHEPPSSERAVTLNLSIGVNEGLEEEDFFRRSSGFSHHHAELDEKGATGGSGEDSSEYSIIFEASKQFYSSETLDNDDLDEGFESSASEPSEQYITLYSSTGQEENIDPAVLRSFRSSPPTRYKGTVPSSSAPQPTLQPNGASNSSRDLAATSEGPEEVKAGVHSEKRQLLSLFTEDARRVIESLYRGCLPGSMGVGEFLRSLANGSGQVALEPLQAAAHGWDNEDDTFIVDGNPPYKGIA